MSSCRRYRYRQTDRQTHGVELGCKLVVSPTVDYFDSQSSSQLTPHTLTNALSISPLSSPSIIVVANNRPSKFISGQASIVSYLFFFFSFFFFPFVAGIFQLRSISTFPHFIGDLSVSRPSDSNIRHFFEAVALVAIASVGLRI